VSETLSLSIFTIEADRKPLLAFGANKYQEAEAFCADERVRTKLRSVRSGGVPVCDDHSILRVRPVGKIRRKGTLPRTNGAAIVLGKPCSGLSNQCGRSLIATIHRLSERFHWHATHDSLGSIQRDSRQPVEIPPWATMRSGRVRIGELPGKDGPERTRGRKKKSD
jgi:hypothetical protein